MTHFGLFGGYQKWHLGCPNQNSKTTFQYPLIVIHFNCGLMWAADYRQAWTKLIPFHRYTFWLEINFKILLKRFAAEKMSISNVIKCFLINLSILYITLHLWLWPGIQTGLTKEEETGGMGSCTLWCTACLLLSLAATVALPQICVTPRNLIVNHSL